jgi:hypothetical protein
MIRDKSPELPCRSAGVKCMASRRLPRRCNGLSAKARESFCRRMFAVWFSRDTIRAPIRSWSSESAMTIEKREGRPAGHAVYANNARVCRMRGRPQSAWDSRHLHGTPAKRARHHAGPAFSFADGSASFYETAPFHDRRLPSIRFGGSGGVVETNRPITGRLCDTDPTSQ